MQRTLTFATSLAFLALGCTKKADPAPPEPARSEAVAVVADAAAPTAQADASPPASADPQEDEPERGIGLALSVSNGGKKHARAEALLLRPKSRKWETVAFDDPTSRTFYKVISLLSSIEDAQMLTFGGDLAAVKGWRRAAEGFAPAVLWAEKLGGKASRMRDAELGDVDNNNAIDIVVGSHDQGLISVLKRNPAKLTEWQVEKVDRIRNTLIEEIEVGDLDRDGSLEIYALPREAKPGKGGEGPGRVLRYVPAKGEKATVVADLGERHAREIFVQDVDGDGAAELYVALEALSKGTGENAELVDGVQILRFDANTAPSEGVAVAFMPDLYCRSLTAGDVDGDGHRELFASCARTGVWMIKHGGIIGQAWSVQQIDKQVSGEQQAALAADIDSDGRDELYVAADDQGEVRRYTWEKDGKSARDVIVKRPEGSGVVTWSITQVGR